MVDLDFHVTEKTDLSQPYKTFVRQLSKWYNGGELPELAGQDLRFVLELQRQKLEAMGLTMQCELKKMDSAPLDISNFAFGDRIFINNGVSSRMHMTRTISSTQEHPYTQDLSVIAMIQELKSGCQPDAKMTLCCPHCGAPTTLGELINGCSYCGTRFLMSDLFPKVMYHFLTELPDDTRQKSKNKRDLAILITACSILLIIVSFLFDQYLIQTTGTTLNPNASMMERIIADIMGGAMLGGIMFVFKKLFEVLGLMRKQLRGCGKTVSTMMIANKIKKHDPEFSSEYFRDKVMSLFRMAVYSKDATKLACCKCRCPGKASDIIEAQLHNFNIKSCKIKNMVCDVEVTLFLDCLHYRKKKVRSRSDKFRMKIRKHLKTPTELGFSFAAVSCPSCGASFDARNVKACPYCGKPYLHEHHDWVIMDIR